MTAGPTRRSVLAGLTLFAAGPAGAAAVPVRIVALEWGIVSMLLSIGIVPVGIGEADGYRTWVAAPGLPAGIAEVGVRNEPSLEALAALRPDVILVSPLSRSIIPFLAAVAPVREIAVYTEARAPVRRIETELRALAAAYGRPADAERAVATFDRDLLRVRDRLSARTDRPVVAVNFMDARHVRVFGPGSLFDDVLGRIGIRNAWTRPGGPWGFDLVGIEALAAHPDAWIAVVPPVPPDVRLAAERPSLWAGLPAVRAGRVRVLAPAWPFGDLVAGQRFAIGLADALDPAGEPLGGR